jgi:hypothetical protein
MQAGISAFYSLPRLGVPILHQDDHCSHEELTDPLPQPSSKISTSELKTALSNGYGMRDLSDGNTSVHTSDQTGVAARLECSGI